LTRHAEAQASYTAAIAVWAHSLEVAPNQQALREALQRLIDRNH